MDLIRRLEEMGQPGDDSWDREGDLPPQPFDLWTRTNVGENLPFPITPLTEPAQDAPALAGMGRKGPSCSQGFGQWGPRGPPTNVHQYSAS